MNILVTVGLLFIVGGVLELFLRRKKFSGREIARQLVLLFAITLGLVRLLVAKSIPPWADAALVIVYVVLTIGAIMARPARPARPA